ncbi:hypothetical protein A3D01_01075 [Candidatus Woesebacteria bacterium RIFCSPHIGHO2_02_FULL_39_13]|uniref:PIN domain-containing protein n=1 Tax=Candidatus Woesebacteria bacterium RIFCSPHIGHO2_02_FULL_39_13 TaxID=1802505 RepID=A0A1F7Z0X1_9BACT|nr:MAG: hypothetical protein A3D01_01075 [Candidatus Woesebacteria bacterium RIFCSPHIGHO2_02_FULL_39_13]OGM74364.1 MAG: hypothetical protein A3H19_01925 [Candidatus Woesebacteria bacterium RIFCSPLOWO2_12_FULL_39_9]
MIFLDTNYLIRFFTRDIEAQAKKAKKIIEKSEKIYVPLIVIAEAVYILETHYKTKKETLCSILTNFVNQSNIICAPFVIGSFDIYRHENISFYDSLLASEAIYERGSIATFDKRLNKIFLKYKSR